MFSVLAESPARPGIAGLLQWAFRPYLWSMVWSVVIAGATGLVGKEVLNRCLEHTDIAVVRTVGRSPVMVQHPKLEAFLVDFEAPGAFEGLPSPDVVFCCLGTTMAKAGSREAFRRVDFDYVLALARWARAAGCPAFHLISAIGADAASPVFYSRVKGEVDRDVLALGFEETVVYRPSLLLGARQDRRVAEAVAQRAMPFFRPMFRGPLAPYRPIGAGQLASTMVQRALLRQKGAVVLAGDALFAG
jgi:uncharacterized protein YbjT (DUF2867 family)